MIFVGLHFFFLRLILVGLGSAIGGVVRYLIGAFMKPQSGFPWHTLAINVTGSLVIALASGFLARSESVRGEAEQLLRCFLLVGLCGGFTTFSTFSHEAFQMLENGQHLSAALYLTASVSAGLVAVFLGYAISR